MVKFFRLVKNEYLKIFKKKGNYVLLGILLLVLIGMMFIYTVARNSMGLSVSDDRQVSSDYYNGEIDWLNSSKPENYEKQKQVYKFLGEHGLSEISWGYSVLSVYISEKNNAVDYTDVEKLEGFVENNDWRGYYEYLESSSQLTDTQKWEIDYRTKNDISPIDNSEKSVLVNTIVETKKNIESCTNKTLLNEYNDRVTLLEYQLDNDIDYNVAEVGSILDSSSASEVNFWSVFKDFTSMVQFVTIIMIIIAGGIVSNEFSQGTIKFLLVNPVKRWKILMSKYFTCISLGYILIEAVFLLSIPLTGLFFSFDGIGASYMSVKNGEIVSCPGLLYQAGQFLLNSVSMVVMITLAFAMSAFFRKTALAIGLSVYICVAGEGMMQLLQEFGCDWGRYFISSNLNLSAVINGSTIFPQQTLLSAILNIAAYMIVFLLTAWDSFTKKSV